MNRLIPNTNVYHIQLNMRSFFLFYIKLSSDESMKSVHFEKVSYFEGEYKSHVLIDILINQYQLSLKY